MRVQNIDGSGYNQFQQPDAGATRPTPEAVQKLADKFGVDFDKLSPAVNELFDATHPVNASGAPTKHDPDRIDRAIIALFDLLKPSSDANNVPAPTPQQQPAGDAGNAGGAGTGDITEAQLREMWYRMLGELGIPPDQIEAMLALLLQPQIPVTSSGDSSGDAGGGGVGTPSAPVHTSRTASLTDMGSGDSAGTDRPGPDSWTKRSGKNSDPNFASSFDQGMVNGNTLAIQGNRGAEVVGDNINANRQLGTYYYSSQKTPSDGLVQSGFIYGSNRAFEVDHDEPGTFTGKTDPNVQMTSIWWQNAKVAEIKYTPQDLGFKNFSDQPMHFKTVITDGHVSEQALNSQGKWQELAQFSDKGINAQLLHDLDFKPMMSTWRIAGRPDDGQRHEMTGDMSFTPA